MSLVLKGKNVNLQDRTKDYIEKKVSKFYRFLPNINEIRVELSQEATRSSQDRFIAEITVRAKKKILRAEERSSDLHSAIDIAVDKLKTNPFVKNFRPCQMKFWTFWLRKLIVKWS
ncbi:MAG: ribosomal subunit interface protein [Anaerolineaceae bacterium 4572_5.1]|nr:MAG: ribosomal subunit interface protein [Anaerolineaceae bacterium 4572_5.1]